jgi:hypothetical protein
MVIDYRKYLEGSGCDLYNNTIQTFANRDQGKSRKSSVRITGNVREILITYLSNTNLQDSYCNTYLPGTIIFRRPVYTHLTAKRSDHGCMSPDLTPRTASAM